MKRFFVLFPFFLFPFLALAEEAPTPTVAFPCLLSGVAGFTCPAVGTSIPAYIVNLYQFMVGVSGIVAVAMIVTGGIFITISGSVDKKSEGKDMITSALFGMALLLGSWLILSTVNTRLVENFDIPGINPITSTVASVQVNTAYKCITPTSTSCYPRVVDGFVGTISTSWFESDININGKIWRHLYYTGEGSSRTEQCFIYAYRNKDSSTTEKIPIETGWSPC